MRKAKCPRSLTAWTDGQRANQYPHSATSLRRGTTKQTRWVRLNIKLYLPTLKIHSFKLFLPS